MSTGYGKPPKKTQFPKGVSGNPKGRPKQKDFVQELLEELNSLVAVVDDNGKKTKLTKQRIIIKKLVSRWGSLDAELLKLLPRLLPKNTTPEEVGPAVITLSLGDPRISERVSLASRKKELEEELEKIKEQIEKTKNRS